MKTFLITGATNGIGKETAKMVIRNKMHLIIVSRNKQLIKQTTLELLQIDQNAKIDSFICDFSNIESILNTTNEIKTKIKLIDYLYINAGAIVNNPKISMLTNYVGPRLFLNELMQLFDKSNEKMILNTISMSSPKKYKKANLDKFDKYNKTRVYAISKLATSAHLFELSHLESGLKFRLIDPTIVYSNATINFLPRPIRFIHPLIKLVSKSPIQIADEINHIISSKTTSNILVYRNNKNIKPNPVNFDLRFIDQINNYYKNEVKAYKTL